MARGADAKLRRRQKRKNENEEVTNMFNVTSDSDDDSDNDQQQDNGEEKKEKKSKKEEPEQRIPKKNPGIKTTPLILLIMMVGTTILPALIYASDMIANYAQKHHVLGSIGFRLGVGAVPRQRVLSFYEKHDPNKIEEVPNILAKHYGDYPKLVKKLERKYQDYGYFLGWEEDEAPLTLALEQIAETREYFVNQYWNRYAPQILKTAARNIRYNLAFVYKKGSKAWKRQVWPILEPFLGVPKGAEKQRRKDAKEAKARKEARTGGAGTRRKNRDYRDDVEE
ncbi:expressed unknown protein [Seminavis robusta]|uniref:Uncharacterized protein n=1 Tax=Seminavis robusta TaxID=568900 RepID=A0A9N8HJH7_9STRA|nr:expressed unknown protein [Seminavis robusta]|eukprot:Sro861_g212310.1 n/a (281) ;mRNA; f:32839-33681